MKKETARKKTTARTSGQAGHFATKGIKGPVTRSSTTSRSTPVAARSINAVNYAKVMSYIVRTEEDETRMMIAASDSMISH